MSLKNSSLSSGIGLFIGKVPLKGSTPLSPTKVFTEYMSFRSSRSQESNASNGAQIKAKMKKLWPLEDNRTKLKDNFASCEITKFNLRNQPFLAKWTLSTCEILASHFSNLQNPSMCSQIFATDSFRFFLQDFCCLNPYFLLVIHQS